MTPAGLQIAIPEGNFAFGGLSDASAYIDESC